MSLLNFSGKRVLSTAMAAALLAGFAFGGTAIAKSKQTDTNATQEIEGYLFKSARYNYQLICPKKPLGAIPAKLFFNDQNKKGDVIIFETVDGNIYNVKTAWIVLVDAFAADSLPDLTKLTTEESRSMLEKIQENNGYVMIALVDLPPKNKGIYAITAKEVEIDSDNDGKPDAIAKTDTQMAVTFFRGDLGGRFCMQLIDNPQLRTAAVEDYQNGVLSFKELNPDDGQSKPAKNKKK